MKTAMGILILLLAVLASHQALADDRDRHGNRGYGNDHYGSRYDDSPRWRVNVNVNRGFKRGWRNTYRRPYRPYRPQRAPYSNRAYQQGFTGGLSLGALFASGLTGNYRARPYPVNRWHSSTVIYRSSRIITPAVNTTRYTRVPGNCYETHYDSAGNEYRVELDSRRCR